MPGGSRRSRRRSRRQSDPLRSEIGAFNAPNIGATKDQEFYLEFRFVQRLIESGNVGNVRPDNRRQSLHLPIRRRSFRESRSLGNCATALPAHPAERSGCDPNFAFEDLANAVRKISLDLKVRIEFHGIEALKTRPTGDHPSKDAQFPIVGPYHAISVIHYAEGDAGEEDGIILYLKPAYHLGFQITDSVLTEAFSNGNYPEDWMIAEISKALKSTVLEKAK
jgi:hypothetical protein